MASNLVHVPLAMRTFFLLAGITAGTAAAIGGCFVILLACFASGVLEKPIDRDHPLVPLLMTGACLLLVVAGSAAGTLLGAHWVRVREEALRQDLDEEQTRVSA